MEAEGLSHQTTTSEMEQECVWYRTPQKSLEAQSRSGRRNGYEGGSLGSADHSGWDHRKRGTVGYDVDGYEYRDWKDGYAQRGYGGGQRDWKG